MTLGTTARKLATAVVALAGFAQASGAVAADKPESLDVSIFTFMSGPAAAYGLPGKQGAEMMIKMINSTGGVAGVPIEATYVDEAQGAEGVISEYRRLAGDDDYDFSVAALSSGNCLALAPLADQLKMPTVGWNCDTHQLFLKGDHEYFFRPNGNTIAEFMAYTLYFLDMNPDVERVAIINPDYAFGHDAAEIVKAVLHSMKPDVEIVAELFPRLGASTYQTEISRLSAAQPDVIFSNLWGGDLENFVRQAQPRGLFDQSQVVLALGEAILQRVPLPDGVIVGVLGDGWWMSPDARALGMAEVFAKDYKAQYGEYPVFPSLKMANSILLMKMAFEQAIQDNGVAWPSAEQLTAALKGMEAQTMTGTIHLREDNDGIVDQVVGVTQSTDAQDFPVLGKMVRYDGEDLIAPVGQDPIQWIDSLSPQFLESQPKPGSYQ